jgi:hypothetical protein
MLIQARHPAIVRHVPARARKERIELAATVTPVSLAEADPSEFPEAGTLRPGDAWRALRIHAHAGGIWSRLDEGHGHKTLARRPMAGDLASFLEGRAGPEVAAALARTFRRTPLVACGAGPQDGLFEHGYADATGAEIDLERSRRVDLDGRTAASAELVAWLGENVRIVGGEPFVRRIPLLEVSCNTEVAGLRVEEGAMTTGFRTLVTTAIGKLGVTPQWFPSFGPAVADPAPGLPEIPTTSPGSYPRTHVGAVLRPVSPEPEHRGRPRLSPLRIAHVCAPVRVPHAPPSVRRIATATPTTHACADSLQDRRG